MESIAFRPPSLFYDSSWLATKACQVTTVTLILLYTTNLLHEAWGLHVPRTKLSTLLHIKLEGRRIAGEPPKLQGAGVPRYKLE